MSIALPFLALLLVGAIAAYHRVRLAIWAAATLTALIGCMLLGANITAAIIATLLAALVAVPLLVPQIRLPFITRPLLGFYTKPWLRTQEAWPTTLPREVLGRGAEAEARARLFGILPWQHLGLVEGHAEPLPG